MSSSADRTQRTRMVSYGGLLLCLALLFSYLESQLPLTFVPIPGIKLGFANLIVMFCAYTFGMKAAAVISVLRIFLTALLFGGWSAFWFSLGGALCALFVMGILLGFCQNHISPLGISVAAAAAHNIGQLLAASLYLMTSAVFSYLPTLLIAGALTGSVTGLLLCLLLRALPHTLFHCP